MGDMSRVSCDFSRVGAEKMDKFLWSFNSRGSWKCLERGVCDPCPEFSRNLYCKLGKSCAHCHRCMLYSSSRAEREKRARRIGMRDSVGNTSPSAELRLHSHLLLEKMRRFGIAPP